MNENLQPMLCAKGCGFYGNPKFDMMCSKCYTQLQKAKNPETREVDLSPTISAPAPTLLPAAETPSTPLPSTPLPVSVPLPPLQDASVLVQSPVPVEPAATMAPVPALAEASSGVPQTMQSGGAEQPSRPVQDNKGRCFTCKGKIAMAKQAPNTCKCGYTFCDLHRYPEKHSCDFDFKAHSRVILEKNNPRVVADKI